jgi:transposase, IS5 family
MTRIAEPQVSFADLEFCHQGVFLDPILEAISTLLKEQGELIEHVRRDLERGLKNPATGRNGLTPEQVLRALVLKQVKNWDYRELRERIADGYTLRSFTEFLSQPVPKHDAFNRAFNRLTPETLRMVNDLLVETAVELGLEDGKQLRVDTTVVQTDIHHPTDNTLLWDTVRVVTRLVGQFGQTIGQAVKGFRNHTRAARRRMQQIQRMTPKQRQQQQTPKYRELIAITEDVVNGAQDVLRRTRKVKSQDLVTELAIGELRKEIEHYCQLGKRVIDQSRRRVLEGEQVPAAEKVYSIFEPHTDLIKRGKVQTPVEFGHKVFLAESANGLITQYQVLDGNPSDEDQLQASLESHRRMFGDSPKLYSADRGFYSENNVHICEQNGVETISIPQRGGSRTPQREAYEKSSAFKKGQRFRAGIEGRISVLFRGRGMKRCLAHGRARFELLVGAAVLANNLMRIATLLLEQPSQGRLRA